ncbi:MAG TPA: hypothetical protein VMZ28_01505 [Kofleriaceae bacterium]|nr:hypothetical protein [Kofleriaceae bacterium]
MIKRVGVAAAVIGVAALMFGLFSKRWVVGTDYGIETHVGLHSMEQCQLVQPDLSEPGELACGTLPLSEIANTPSAIEGFDTFSLVARGTFYTGLACSAIALLLALLALANRFPSFFIAPSTLGILASFATLVLMAITLAVHPWKKVGWGTGNSYLLTGAGAILCLIASIALGRLKSPVSDDF